jgi:hypothetical protein
VGAISTPANWQTIVNKPANVADLGVSDFNAKAIEAQAGAAHGGIGTYAFLSTTTGMANQTNGPGATRPGSHFHFAGVSGTNSLVSSSVTPSGTWKCMGYSLYNNPHQGMTLWVRIA